MIRDSKSEQLARAICGLRRYGALVLLVGTAAALIGCSGPKGYDVGRCSKVPQDLAKVMAKAAGTLRVMTANMWGIPIVARDVRARFDALADRLNGDATLDVVGLQEMWDGGARAAFLEKVAAQFPYRVDFHSEYGRSGLVIVSRRPFVGRSVFVPFEQTGKWWKPWTGEWWGGKGVGGVRIDAGDTQPWVFTTHLHACYEATEGACDQDDEYAGYRQAQIEVVRRAVDQIAGGDAAVILGDFNFTTRSRYVDLLAGASRDTVGFDPAWSLVSEPNAPRGRIDHIWLRPGQSLGWKEVEPALPTHAEPVALADGRQVGLSDHCPIVASLTPK